MGAESRSVLHGVAPPAGSAHEVARLGVLGGSFNPPHLGHLALARHALRELELDELLLVPAQRSPHKLDVVDPGGEHRLQMCRLLLAGEQRLSAGALELERPGPSYTVDTLRALHARHPYTRLTFVLGDDVARTLLAWRAPRELLALAELAVVLRADSSRAPDGEREVRRTLGGLPQERVRFLAMPPIEVSSSQVRARIQSGESIDALVGADVAKYIAARQLYRVAGAEVVSASAGETQRGQSPGSTR